MVTYTDIKKEPMIWKFCMYGFLKNLEFFEPYLLIYLIGMGLNLFQIGLLFAIRQVVMYVFEIPSGIIADHYGKKKELMMCFIFYMVSFVLFFWGLNLWIMALGMVFYGLGEAFRSGTHKAMILAYLEHRGWYEHKGYVYGRTRAYSLLGSSLSAFVSIILVLNLPALRWIFLVCIIPYVLDFLLIASYPSYLDEKKETLWTFKVFLDISRQQLKSVFQNKRLKKILLSSASFDGIFKTIKDYIQPIMMSLILAAGVGSIMAFEGDQVLKIILGMIYGVFYIFSSLVSKNVYRVSHLFKAQKVFERLFDLMGVLFLGLALMIHFELLWLSVVFYFILYLLKDARRPVFVDVCSDHMDRDQRATVLSIESQIGALLMVIFAPLFGWVADVFSISFLFLIIGVVVLLFNRMLLLKTSDTFDA